MAKAKSLVEAAILQARSQVNGSPSSFNLVQAS